MVTRLVSIYYDLIFLVIPHRKKHKTKMNPSDLGFVLFFGWCVFLFWDRPVYQYNPTGRYTPLPL